MARRSAYLFPLICSALAALASAASAVAHAIAGAIAYAFPFTEPMRLDQEGPTVEVEIGRHQARAYELRRVQTTRSRWGPAFSLAA